MLKKLLSLTTAFVLSIGAANISFASAGDTTEKSIRLAVLTDLHYASAPAEEDMENADKISLSEKRMICEAESIFGQTMKEVLDTSPYSILISGDLTSNGEKKNAEELSEKLSELSRDIDGGIYVMNGNHDINNSHAAEFVNGTVKPAERMNTDEFREIFRDFGYGENSRFFGGKAGDDIGCSGELSYVTEICDGVTLIVLDGGCYSNDKNKQYSAAQKTGGEISPELLEWAASESKAASEKGDLVLAMCHYGIIPHMDYKGSLTEAFNSNFVVANWQDAAETLADAGTAAVLTGHYHGNDISSYTSRNGSKIYDIQTASIVNYPVSWRTIDLTVTEKNGKKSYNIDVDTNFVHEINGTVFEYNGVEYNDIQQYAFNKYGINKDTISGLAEFFSREILYDIRHFDDDTCGSGLQGYLRQAVNAENNSFGDTVSEKAKQLINEKLPVETSFSLGGTGAALGIMSDISINISRPVIDGNTYTSDLTMKYSCGIGGQVAEVTETAKISLDFSVLSAAVDNTIAELQKEIDRSEFTNYSSSDIKEDINKLLADILNSVADIRPDGKTAVAEILNDAYSVQARGNEETEVDEAVKQTFGEDVTLDEMKQKRLEWNKQLTDDTFIDEAFSAALRSISGISRDPGYRVLSGIMNTPFTEDERSIITFTDTSMTAEADGSETDVSGRMSLLDILTAFLPGTDNPGKVTDTAVLMQNFTGFVPKDVLSDFMSGLSQLHLAMTENYSENEDLHFSFEYTPAVKTASPVRVAGKQVITDNSDSQAQKSASDNAYDCPKTSDSSHVAVWLAVLTVSLAAAVLSGRKLMIDADKK